MGNVPIATFKKAALTRAYPLNIASCQMRWVVVEVKCSRWWLLPVAAADVELFRCGGQALAG
jgi:hypothetical protein